MSESGKDIARKIVAQMYKDDPSMVVVEEDEAAMAKAIDALNIAFAPPVGEGSVRVRIAVGVECADGLIRYGDSLLIQPNTPEAAACGAAFRISDSHQGIVEAWIPRVAPTPTIAGRVV